MIRTEDGEVIARDHGVADSFLSRARGMMLRRSFPEGEALVFEFPEERRVGVHMLFVAFSLDVVFLDEEDFVVSVRTLRPWIGYAVERAATAVELPAGAAETVEEGDRLIIE